MSTTKYRQSAGDQLSQAHNWNRSLQRQLAKGRAKRDKAIVQCYQAGMTVREIATITDLTVSRVGQILLAFATKGDMKDAK